MPISLYLPVDEFSSRTSAAEANWDLSADYLELTAYFSSQSYAPFSELVSAMEVASELDRLDVDGEISSRGEIVSATRDVIRKRVSLLGDVYPFELHSDDDGISYVGDSHHSLSTSNAFGRTAYMISLVLSNLPPVSQILDVSEANLNKKEVKKLREFFQYFATLAMAGEVSGSAWSFGFPRPKKSKFIKKLKEIWIELGDGEVKRHAGASVYAKDDKVDVFAARRHRDNYPGFLLAAGQVATGKNWKEKSIFGHLQGAFQYKWFSMPPATRFICYHIIPFICSDRDVFSVRCAELGNILHRLRIPYRVAEACILNEKDSEIIEAVDELDEAVEWVKTYKERGRNS